MAMNARDRIKIAVTHLDGAIRPWAERRAANALAYEFLLFGLKQAWACLFGAAMIALLALSHFAWPQEAPVARYDFLVIAAITLQAGLLLTRLERPDEAAVILAFHIVGAVMEVFKTAKGSWIYPEASCLRLGGVPLFSGFMYAAIGSYIARIWRIFEIRFTRYPPVWATWVLALAAYVNFFSHHFGPDIRFALFAASVILFGPTLFHFRPDRRYRAMPFLLGLVLVSLFVWIAENLGTFTSAWIYPSQQSGWAMVSLGKMGAWYLLLLLSFVLVSLVHRPAAMTQIATEQHSPTPGDG